jgi:hypothetical protein
MISVLLFIIFSKLDIMPRSDCLEGLERLNNYGIL